MRIAPVVIVTSIACLASALPAAAISRYNSTGMQCGRIQQILAREGAVIFRYPSTRVKGLPLYDRYVRSGRYCDPHQVLEQTTIPSRDGQCPVLHCIAAPDPCDDFMARALCN